MTRALEPERESGARKRRPARQSAEEKLQDLQHRLREISDLKAARAVLAWDQATYMPPGGAEARGRQRALLSRLAHQKGTDTRIGKLLDDLQPYAETLGRKSDTASLIRIARREFEKLVKVPAEYIERAAALSAASYQAWASARPANDFPAMRPFLEHAIELSREYAEFFRPFAHVADPLIDDADQGMTADSVRTLFYELRGELLPMVQPILRQSDHRADCWGGCFVPAAQLEFVNLVIASIGYDLERGRVDQTLHPFCTRFAGGDVRITVRVRANDVCEALFSALHEAGHALYEQGVASALDSSPLGRGTSAGLHESQSRLWENVVGRSRGFWTYFYPLLQSNFGDQFAHVPLQSFYRAINRVKTSLIRTEADELTYNFHIMMRFDLELALLEGTLASSDLPEAWRAAMKADLDVSVADDRDGCLQDVHWYSGLIGGGFQGYTIGNILSAQFYAAALRSHPDIPQAVARGEFGILGGWLREHIYQHGRKFTPMELSRRATGEPISIRPYVNYLRSKYGELYGLPETSPEAAGEPARAVEAGR